VEKKKKKGTNTMVGGQKGCREGGKGERMLEQQGGLKKKSLHLLITGGSKLEKRTYQKTETPSNTPFVNGGTEKTKKRGFSDKK